MQKMLKKIVAVFVLVIMLMTMCVPAMAAEQANIDAETESKVLLEENERNGARATLNGEFHYTGRLTKNKVLGTVKVKEKSKTIQWTVGRTGSSGTVILKITNQSTGNEKTFTTIANNQLDSITYVGKIEAGTWEVSVTYVSSNWLYDVDLYFYP